MQTLPTTSLYERIVLLQMVPLFAALEVGELHVVASKMTERLYVSGETIAEQGETGDEMYIIVTGEVGVLIHGEQPAQSKEVARRGKGDYVGEMAIISEEPRMASLVALSDVRVLCLDRRQFEGVLRERPQTGLAVIKVLCQRLMEAPTQ